MTKMFEPNKLFLENYQNERRIKRQSIIKKIEEITNRKLIVYTASFQHPAGSIQKQEIPIIEDLLASVSESKNKSIDLMMHSPGGELGATEKILQMIRERFDNFRMIVPNQAKSAATMLGLGSDEILMGYLSELGPIDPQILKTLPNGTFIFIPAHALINTLEHIKNQIRNNEPYQVYMPILSNIEPEMIDICQKAISESSEVAEQWLKKYMLRGYPEEAIKKVVEDLGSTKVYKTHGKMISAVQAKSMGLNVTLIDKEDTLWKLIWELYYRSEIELEEKPSVVKLFETANSSVNITVAQQIIK